MHGSKLPKYLEPWSLDHVERVLSETRDLIIDTETEGLDWKKDKICGWVLGASPRIEDTTYLPVRHKGNEGRGNLDPVKVAQCIAGAIKRNPRVRLKGFNLGFDLKFMAQDGVHFDLFQHPFEDGMINAFLIYELQNSFSLDACCRWMKVTEKKGEELYKHLAATFGGEPTRDQMGNFHRLPADDYLGVDYATGDSISTAELIEAQQAKLDEPDEDGRTLREIWDTECRTIRALVRMELRGVAVDEERLAQVGRIVQEQLNKAKRKLPKDFNPRAPTQMQKLLTDNKVPKDTWPRTGKGNYSFPEAWLATIPIGRDVIAARKLENLESSFLAPLRERHLYRGRVHTTFNQTRGEEYGTVTGRLSSSQPNMQQVHKRNMLLGALFRSIFVPDEGKLMAGADYSQCEPRLLADSAQVELLIKGYLSDPPIDAHSMVAMGAFGYVPNDDSRENKDKRQSGKTLNQALLTGAGETKAALMLGKPHAEAMQIVANYFKSMPEIKPWQRNVMSVFKRRGFLVSLLGRRLHLDDPRFAYRGGNRILQGGNADIIKRSMARIDEYLAVAGSSVEMLLNVHDDIVYQYGEDDLPVFEHCLDIMRDFGPEEHHSIYLTVPMEVDAKSGHNWAEASYGKDDVRKVFEGYGARY